MRILCSEKKSAPKIGWRTVAIQKLCAIVCPGAKERVMDLFPKVWIVDPLAATRSEECGRDRSECKAG